ncbi:peptidyl-prolyl cis-trans isomerase FKBP42-like [Silene latifolia]|uniref:peptidyl-prolyl cis-trans isomerase FKBP42-like n=1 Tax=Silene latifolia TaxID=37657 RepID=UPI003D780766
MSSASGVEFLEYFAFVFCSDKLVGVDADLQSILTQLDVSPFSKIHALKEFGNSLFREKQFSLAGDFYDQACRQLGVALKDNFGFDINSIISLAVSLCLNLAACSNKIQAFDGSLIFCNVILTFFPKNAKALFRKVVALRHLNRLLEARVTLKEAQVVEPHNKDIIRELEAVVQALEINHNGKRVIVDTFEGTEVQVGKKCVSSFQAP